MDTVDYAEYQVPYLSRSYVPVQVRTVDYVIVIHLGL
jgi:hypothetical protein